ncbi:MAG: c-type cytochrome, partial [Phycisphaerae bacterium]
GFSFQREGILVPASFLVESVSPCGRAGSDARTESGMMRKKITRRRLFLCSAVVLLLLGAVGGVHMAQRADARAPDAPPAAAKGSPDHTVLLTNIEFKPNRLKVKAGDSIKFINQDKFNHDVYLVRTANRNDVLVPATTIPAGQSVIVTVDREGLFTLYCTIHGGMTGKITTTDTFELTEEEKKRAAARKVIPPIVKTGEALYWGKAQCHRCHMIGERGTHLRGPNHQDLGFRAAARAAKFGLSSATEYIVQSVMDPSAHIVEGYSDDMPKVYQPPISLSEAEIKAVVAYLQSQGGEADAWSININKQMLATKPAPDPFIHGSPRRGQWVFQDMGCGSCHTTGDHKAISVAPDFTAIGAYRDWAWLAQSITDPNAEVGANWRDAIVYLKPGVVRKSDAPLESDDSSEEEDFDFDAEPVETSAAPQGVEAQMARANAQMGELREQISQLQEQRAGGRSDSAEAVSAAGDTAPAEADSDVELGEGIPGVLRKNGATEVTLLVGPERFETFPREQVAKVIVSTKSRMATNYGKLMSFQQIADLIQYLKSLKGATSPTPSQHLTGRIPKGGPSDN